MICAMSSPSPTPFRLADQNPIAFVPTRDFVKARQFYQTVLGLRLIAEQMPFALVFDCNGIMLRVIGVKELNLNPHTTLGWEVPDIGVAVDALAAAGVWFERYPGMGQDERGIWSVPGAKVAWFKDPDGNTLSVSQHG